MSAKSGQNPGDAAAQIDLAQMYATGEGVARDTTEALRWMRMAAEQGHRSAQFNMGYSFMNGVGVAEDKVTALMWLTLASAQKQSDAIAALPRLSRDMTQKQIVKAQKMATEWQEKHGSPGERLHP